MAEEAVGLWACVVGLVGRVDLALCHGLDRAPQPGFRVCHLLLAGALVLLVFGVKSSRLLSLLEK